MINDARRHEHGRLEGRVIGDMEDGRENRERPAHARKGSDQAQMTDRRIGEKAFHIMAEQRHDRPQQTGRHTDPGNGVEPQLCPAESGGKADQDKHPGLHHSRRM